MYMCEHSGGCPIQYHIRVVLLVLFALMLAEEWDSGPLSPSISALLPSIPALSLSMFALSPPHICPIALHVYPCCHMHHNMPVHVYSCHCVQHYAATLKLCELIAHGGFSTVYKGLWQGLEVAIKVSDPCHAFSSSSKHCAHFVGANDQEAERLETSIGMNDLCFSSSKCALVLASGKCAAKMRDLR